MVAGFGVRRRGPVIEAGACAAALILAVGACQGSALLVGEERPRPTLGPDDPDELGSITPAVPPPDVALTGECPSTPEARQLLLGCWPTRHLGSWRGFFTGIPRYETIDGGRAEFPPGDVLLELDGVGAARLTFAAPPRGTPAGDPITLCSPSDEAPGCPTLGQVIAGFAYELRELELFDAEAALPPRITGEPLIERAERMVFVVHVNEPWDIWCSSEQSEHPMGCAAEDCLAGDWLPAAAAIDAPAPAAPESQGCRCDTEGCGAEAAGPSLRISLQMSADGKALRGSYEPSDVSLGAARLELRKAEP